ncbi:MAG: NAD-dependent epimerase/dehydratase family protein [Bacteroidota bacterium]
MSTREDTHLLITGGAGFIGSWLAEYALSLGARVTVMDDLSTGLEENLVRCWGHENFHFSACSISDHSQLAELAEQATHIAHLASPVGVDCVTDIGHQQGQKITQEMVAATRLLLEIVQKNDGSLFFASSSEVYVTQSPADSDQALLGEDSPLNLPEGDRWWYARMKARIEQMIDTQISVQSTGQAIAGRLFNVTGPRQRVEYGMVLPAFSQAALHQKPMPVYGDGGQVRSFSHVFDVIQTIWDLLHVTLSDCQNRSVINIGAYQPITMEALAAEVNRHWGRKPDQWIEYQTGRRQEVEYRAPDLGRLRQLPVHQPRQGIKQIITDIKKWYQNPEAVNPFDLPIATNPSPKASVGS